jgi:ubiquinone biosynthesis protein
MKKSETGGFMNPFASGPSEQLQALDMNALLPDCYADYRQVVKESLLYFLQHLSPLRQMSIYSEQARLASSSSPSDRLVALLRHCPTLHKLGQVIARNRELAPELRRKLQELESLPPAVSLLELLPALKYQLGLNFERLELKEPLAEASVAVVIPFSCARDSALPSEKGVLKILKPGIEERLAEELDIWSELGDYLQERCRVYDIPRIDYRDTLDSVGTLLLNETRLDLEQQHLERARSFYKDVEDVHIPRLFPWSEAGFTAMEHIDGRKVTEVRHLPREVLEALGRCLIRSLVARPFWSTGPQALFHGDPHAGNLFFTSEGKLALLDWSLIVELSKERRKELMQILLAGFMQCENRLCSSIAALARTAVPAGELRELARDSLRQVRQGDIPGFAWLVQLMDRAMTEYHLSFTDDLVLFRKAVFTLTDVVADISSGVSPDRLLFRSARDQLAGELPQRIASPPGDASFGSHLSGLDLFEAWSTLPLSAGRFMLGSLRDLIGYQ